MPMETPRGIQVVQVGKARLLNPTMIILGDNSMEEGIALRTQKLEEAFSSFTHLLAEAGIGPVVAWGDIAMIFHGIPTRYTKFHILTDSRTRIRFCRQKAMLIKPLYLFAGRISVLLAAKCVREIYTFIRVASTNILLQDNPQRPDLFTTVIIIGFSAVRPVFDDIDITGYAQIGGIAFPPLFTLALTYLHAISRSKVDFNGLGLRLLLKCWCAYIRDLGYKPLGRDVMKGQVLDERLLTFWEGGILAESCADL